MRIDKTTHDYYNRLTSFYYQFRMIANNYNQTVKALHTNFNERRAVALLAKLQNDTAALTALCIKIINLTEELKTRQQW